MAEGTKDCCVDAAEVVRAWEYAGAHSGDASRRRLLTVMPACRDPAERTGDLEHSAAVVWREVLQRTEFAGVMVSAACA